MRPRDLRKEQNGSKDLNINAGVRGGGKAAFEEYRRILRMRVE